MRRIKKLVIILFFVMLFIPLTNVNAASCSDVRKAVSELDAVDVLYQKNDCDNATDDKTIYQCNTILVRKSVILSKIFNYNDAKVCPSMNLSSIINDYKGKCSNRLSSLLKVTTDSAMNIFYMIAPFLLIIFGSLDFFKVIASNDPNESKKARSNFIKRLVAFLLLYITPFVVKTMFSLTPYNMDGTNYTCAEEISFSRKTTSPDVSGTYEGYDVYEDGEISGSAGKRIAEGAKQVKTDAKKNNYHYDCNGLSASAQGTSKTNHMCCAELVGGALYRAKIYKTSKLNKIHSASAPTITRNLVKEGWKVINNAKDLKAGDVIVYQKVVPCSGCGHATINGKSYKTAHVEIYAGNKKAYGAGSDDALKKVTNNFWTKSKSLHFLCGLRYPGD
jgi:hypothetical protein